MYKISSDFDKKWRKYDQKFVIQKGGVGIRAISGPNSDWFQIWITDTMFQINKNLPTFNLENFLLYFSLFKFSNFLIRHTSLYSLLLPRI